MTNSSSPPKGRPRPVFRIAAGLATIAALVSFSVVSASPAEASLPLPFDKTFEDASGGALGGGATIESGWLRLTDELRNQSGSWATTDTFDSRLGLDISFDYATYREPSSDPAGDGLAFFLSDGSVAPGTGAFGAALGYACRGAAAAGLGPCTVPGVPGAYVGIGIDEFGAFSTPLNESGPGTRQNTVAVRGSGDGVTGYQYRLGASVPGGVATGSRTQARRVRVLIEPAGQRVEFSVFLNAGGDTPFETVIDHVDMNDWAGQADLPSTLRLGFTGSTGGATDIHEIDDLQVNVPADLAVDKTGPTSAVAGERVTWQITARNRGVNSVVGATVADDLATSVRDVSWTCRSTGGAACVESKGSGSALRAHADLPAGDGTVVYTVTGMLDAATAGTLTNTATISPPSDRSDVDPTNDSATATTIVAREAALSTTKSFTLMGSATAVAPGDDFSYTVTAHNAGPSVAREVGATDRLPDGITFVSSSDPCTSAGQQVTCASTTSLAVGESRPFTFVAHLSADYAGDGADLANIASATSVDDHDGGEPSGPVTVPVVRPAASVSTAKRAELPAGQASVQPGGKVVYILTARNAGPAVAESIGVVDRLPSGLHFVGGDGECTAAGQLVTCTTDEGLETGKERSFRIVAQLDTSYRGDGRDLGNVAVATSPTDPDGGVPSKTVYVPVAPLVEPGPAHPGDPSAGKASTAVPARLAFTGSSIVFGSLLVAAMLAVFGGGFVMLGRRRRG